MHNSQSAATPTRYGILMAIMREYGWSWRELCEAPADLVEEIAIRLEAEQTWTAERQQFDGQMQQARASLGR